MSLRVFQEVLSELVMSPRFRGWVVAAPGEALAAFDLSDQERRRLEALAQDPGLKTGTLIHRSFRLSMLSNALPRTCAVLGTAALKELVGAYWRENPPRNYVYIQEARRFAAFVLGRIHEGAVANDYAEEVLEAELAMLDLGQVPAWQPPGEEAGPEGRAFRLHPSCRVIPFRHDPAAVLRFVAQGQVPNGLPEGECYLLLTSRGAGQVDSEPIAAERGRALRACDGDTVVAADGVIAALARAGYLV